MPAAFALPHMSYEEAMELSYFGAKVLHAATIAPAVAKRIPILIKNTFNPDAPGTRISERAEDDGRLIAKGISSVGDISLLTLRGREHGRRARHRPSGCSGRSRRAASTSS